DRQLVSADHRLLMGAGLNNPCPRFLRESVRSHILILRWHAELVTRPQHPSEQIFKESNMRTSQNNKGFSLIELLIVVAIIGIIAAIAIPNLLASRRAANEGSAQQSLRTMASAEATYKSTAGNGDYGPVSSLVAQTLVDST